MTTPADTARHRAPTDPAWRHVVAHARERLHELIADPDTRVAARAARLVLDRGDPGQIIDMAALVEAVASLDQGSDARLRTLLQAGED